MSFKEALHRERLRKKAAKGFRGYPVATVAYYGPTDQRATKVVVGVIRAEGAEATELHKCFCDTGDARTDSAINEEIFRFLDASAVKSVVVTDRIIGCPHEEGIDYPVGEACPKCPFWKNRDRFSGEMLH